jgi:hypothetical protein
MPGAQRWSALSLLSTDVTSASACRGGSGSPGGRRTHPRAPCSLLRKRRETINPQLVAAHPPGSHERCYLRELNTCSSKISGEHAISSTVLRAFGKDSIEISGFPWLNAETRSIGIRSLTTNCLCTAHNSALSRRHAKAWPRSAFPTEWGLALGARCIVQNSLSE